MRHLIILALTIAVCGCHGKKTVCVANNDEHIATTATRHIERLADSVISDNTTRIDSIIVEYFDNDSSIVKLKAFKIRHKSSTTNNIFRAIERTDTTHFAFSNATIVERNTPVRRPSLATILIVAALVLITIVLIRKKSCEKM